MEKTLNKKIATATQIMQREMNIATLQSIIPCLQAIITPALTTSQIIKAKAICLPRLLKFSFIIIYFIVNIAWLIAHFFYFYKDSFYEGKVSLKAVYLPFCDFRDIFIPNCLAVSATIAKPIPQPQAELPL